MRRVKDRHRPSSSHHGRWYATGALLAALCLAFCGCEDEEPVQTRAAPAYRLICTVTTPSTDPDGDTITYTYRWFKDGEWQPGATTVTSELFARLPVDFLAFGQLWGCRVTPNDGEEDGPSGYAEYGVGWPPEITGWALAAMHGGAEVACPVGEGYVECRASGIRCLLVTFSEALDPDSVDPGAVRIVGAASGDVSGQIESITLEGGGEVLRIAISDMLPDRDSYTVGLPPSLRDLAGNLLDGERQIELVSLRGDTNSNLTVDVGDMLAVRSRLGEAVDASTARYDVDGNGQIEQADMLVVRGFIPR